MIRRKFIQLGALSPLLSLPGVRPAFGSTVEDSFLTEPERRVPVEGEYDVIVCGAGPAGISAAIEAGRTGAKTLLLEVNGCLGGVWTAGLLTWILDHQNKPGLMREIEKRLVERKAAGQVDTGHTVSFDPEAMKFLLEEMATDANVDVLLHSRVVSVAKDRDRVTHVITESKSFRQAWKGNIFIDTTGDGDLAALAGCGFDFGREFDNALQPFSLLVLLTGVELDEIREFTRTAEDSKAGSPSKKLLYDEIVKGGHQPSYHRPGIYPIRHNLHMMMANHEYEFSPIDVRQVTKATMNARKEVNAIVAALKNVGGAWKNLQMVATGEQIGTREGRRIHGIYNVDRSDIIRGSEFEDAVCKVTFGVDVHSVSKLDEEKGEGYSRGIRAKDYDIPLRSLIAKDVAGLMMAGRNISGDFFSHSSYRVTGNAVPMGQAAGRTAAIAAQKNMLPQYVPWKQIGWAPKG